MYTVFLTNSSYIKSNIHYILLNVSFSFKGRIKTQSSYTQSESETIKISLPLKIQDYILTFF